ncbi:hypothetical protein I4U23_008513 [Adineta vaga]|nr:hypothetical protein I4U23_008513 [Adineta vaga]
MRQSRYSTHSSSVSSVASTQQSATNALKSPVPSDYEYLGRLVTRERPIVQKSKSAHQNRIVSQTEQYYQHPIEANHQPIYEEASCSSSGDDTDDIESLSKPLGVIKINDRHLREIYRLPTPPPKVKRVYHRLRSPQTKVIERVFVRRPPPQIIENIIEVPPEKVRIINREKFLGKSKPITRSKLIRLKSGHDRGAEKQIIEEGDDQEEEEKQQQQQQQQQQGTQPIFIPSQQYSQVQPQQATCALHGTFLPQQQVTYTPAASYAPQQQSTQTTTFTHNHLQQPTTTTTMVYPPQPNMHTLGYIQSSIPPHLMFNTQQPLQLPTAQTTTTTPYNFIPQPTVSHQMVKAPTSFNYVPNQIPSVMSFRNTGY